MLTADGLVNGARPHPGNDNSPPLRVGLIMVIYERHPRMSLLTPEITEVRIVCLNRFWSYPTLSYMPPIIKDKDIKLKL